MAVYEMQGQQFEIPDEVQGAQLEETLMLLSQQLEPALPDQLPGDVSMAQIGPVGRPSPREEMAREYEHTARSHFKFPEIGDAPELNEMSMPAFKASLGLLASGDAENAQKVLQSQFPQSSFTQDDQGNTIIQLPSGRYNIRGPMQEAASMTAQGASLVPAGALASGLAKGLGMGTAGLAGLEAAGAAATQTGIESASAATGGEFEGENIFKVAAFAGGGTYTVGKILDKMKGLSATKKIIAEKIESGDTSSDVAKYMVNGSGKIVKDKQFIKLSDDAIKQGFDESVIAMIKGGTPADRKNMLAMTNIVKKARKNARYAATNRPTDIVGDAVINRVNVIKKANTNAGKNLDRVATSLKGKQVDFSPAIQKFSDDLESIGVSMNDDLSLNFAGSDIEGLAAPQNILSTIVKRLSSGGTPDAYDVHRMKRYIDESVTYGKKAEGLAGRAEGIVKELRHNLDGVLDSTFPKYNKVNTKYADTITALNTIQDVAGKKVDLYGPNANKALGTLMRRTLGNAQSRVNLIDSIDEINAVAKKYGGKFNDDLISLMVYADELESVFKPATRTSFKAEIGKEAERAVRSMGTSSTLDYAASGTGRLVDRMRGINEENAFKAIEKILSR